MLRSHYQRHAGARFRLRACQCGGRFATWEAPITDRGSGFVREATWEAKNAENVIKHLKLQLAGFEKREQERVRKIEEEYRNDE